jgi:O-antigen ligase
MMDSPAMDDNLKAGWPLAILLSLSVSGALVSGYWLILAVIPALLLYAGAFRHTEWFYFLLLFTIPLSVEVQVSSSLGTDMPDEGIMWLLCIPILSLILQRNGKARDIIGHHLLFRILLVQIAWAAVTIIFSRHPVISLKYVLAKGWYLLPFACGAVLFLDRPAKRERAAVLLIAATLMASAFVFIRHAGSGFSFDSVNAAARPLFRNHVNYSALLVCILPVAVAGIFWSRRWRPIFIAISIFMLVALFFTFSRGAWVAVPAGLLTAAALHFRFGKPLALAGIVTVASLLVFLARDNRYLDYKPDFNRTIYHSELAAHMQATYHLRDLSTAERFYRWIAAVRMMEGHWMTGYGPNNFYQEYRPFTVRAFRTYVSGNPEKSTVHNYFLLLLTEQGIPGLSLFLLLLAALFHFASRAYHEASDRQGRITSMTMAVMLGMMVTLVSLSDLVETDKIGSLFYSCTGLLALMTGRKESGQESPR